MTDEIKADDSVTATDDAGKTDAPSHNPVKVELEKEQGKVRSEAEKAAFSLKKNAERARELGLDLAEVLGMDVSHETDEDKPLTRREYQEIKKGEAKQTALQMADGIQDEYERSLVRHYLESGRIGNSGDADSDFKLALAAVNSIKNGQIATEINRRQEVKRTALGSSANARTEDLFEPTDEEARMMKPPYNVPLEKIKAARKRSEEK